MHCDHCSVGLVPQLVCVLGLQLLVSLLPKRWFLCNDFSGQHLQVISEGVFGLPGLLRLAIKIADELT